MATPYPACQFQIFATKDASAEYQEAFTENTWMLDAGISESWYNGLMLTTAATR